MFLAHILNKPVVDAAGVRLGWVDDLVLNELDLFPTIHALVLGRTGQGALIVCWDGVADYAGKALNLNIKRAELVDLEMPDDAVFLRRDILDQQVVDINGRRVVRVNDLQLNDIEGDLRLVGADIGITGLLRRLSLERPSRALAKMFRSSIHERIIPWNYVEGIEREWTTLKLNVSHRRLREMPAIEIADIIAQLHPLDRKELFAKIDDDTLADALPHLEDSMQVDVIRAMSDERASDIIELMAPDDAADVLGDMGEEEAERILHLMEPEEAADVRELLQYDDDTAGGRMTTDYIAFSDKLTVTQAMADLRKYAPDAETIYYLYVIDDAEKLIGVLSLRDLLTAPEDTNIIDYTERDVISVLVDENQEDVARILTKYHLLAVPVIDQENVLLGIVTADVVLDVIHEESEEDISRLAGAVDESDEQASPIEQALTRLPSIALAGLAGMVMTILLGYNNPAHSLVLFALLPLLILPGMQIGGLGVASISVMLAEDEDADDALHYLMRTQWVTALLLAAATALVGGAFSRLFDPNANAFGATLIVFAILVLEMLVGSLLPILLDRLRWDPLVISRPALAVLAVVVGVPLLLLVL
ncbi:MAG: CBS domain-containing protein [bacterium]